MHMNEYMFATDETAIYQDKMYPIASLMAEAAELADLFIKPYLRGDDKQPTEEEILGEAGDVLFMLARVLKDHGLELEDAATYNLKKLRDRKARGVIQGSGGDR